MTAAMGAQTDTNGAVVTAAEPAGAPWADTAELAHTAERDALEPDEPADELEPADDEPDTFTREYVTELRRESAEHRHRARDAEARADELAGQLWAERVGALGLLADATDLPYDAEALDDPDAIRAQVDELLERRPHLRTRRITARAGQGEGNGAADSVSLTGIMRAHA